MADKRGYRKLAIPQERTVAELSKCGRQIWITRGAPGERARGNSDRLIFGPCLFRSLNRLIFRNRMR